ncbi:MAG: hypothetical protein ACXWF8_13580 [Methylobacter sp.]
MKHYILLLAASLMLTWQINTQAEVINLLDLSQWQVYGTKSLQGGTLTVGDYLGYDTSDSDHDGNPYEVWFQPNQGQDYDEAVTVNDFTAPFTLTWTGCFPTTQYGYNNIVLGKANPNFTGSLGSQQYMIQQEIGFSTRWDYGSTLNTFINPNGSGNYAVNKVTSATPSNNTFCADYKIVWADNKVLFYYNGTKVDERNYAYTGPVKLVVRSFERPHTFTAMTIDTGTAKPQTPASNPGVGMIQGANISGTLTDASGKVTALNSSNTGVAGDLTFNYDAAGNLIAHISGTVASAGMAFDYEVDYEVATQNLIGTYTDNKDKIAHPITFTNAGGFSWQGRVQGTGYSSDGTPLPYDATFNIVLPAEAITMGSNFPPNGRFNVDLGRTEAISIPVSIPTLGISRNYSTNIITEGRLLASLVPGSNGFTLTGTVEGGVRMDPAIAISETITIPTSVPLPPGVSIPPVTVNINIDATGRFSGVLTGNTAQNNLQFIGNWSSVSSNGATGGGDLVMTIPITATGAVASTTTLLMTGTIKVPIDAGAIPSGTSVPTTFEQPISNQITVPLVFH